MGKIKR